MDDLKCERTGDALIRELESPETANAILWLTPDVATSPAIQQLEAPRILKRCQSGDPFFVEARLSGDLDWSDVSAVLSGVPSLENLTAGWNLSKMTSPLSVDDARAVAVSVLSRRVRAIAAHSSGSLALVLHTREDAPLAYSPDVALQVDWCPFFSGRVATGDAWADHLLPALSDVVSAVQQAAPSRDVEASGLCCLPAGFALGRAFMEPTGLRLIWRQRSPAGEMHWALSDTPENSGFVARTTHTSFEASGLAVLVNVRGDVEPAVHASDLPEFGAVSRIAPESRRYPASIDSPGEAVHLARLVADEIRRARTEYPHLECTHVFLSGPAGLAVLIGQQLNGLGPVQTYEHLQTSGTGHYVPAARLVDLLTQKSP